MIATALTGVVALLAAADGLPTDQPLGWRPSPFFVELRNTRETPDFHREFYPKGESETGWTERAVVSDLTVAAGTTPTQVLDGVRDRAKADCADGEEHRYDLKEKSATQGLGLWHCQRNAKTARGEVALWRVLLAPPHAYLITLQGDYAPYTADKFPLLKAQGDRWIEFQASFALCDGDWTSWGCAPGPNRYMKSAPAELTPEEATAVATAEHRGRELYHVDQLAWHATDFAQEKKLIERDKHGLFLAVAGESFPAGAVYFIRDNGRGEWVRVDIDANAAASAGGKGKDLPDDVRRRVQALDAARKAEIKVCSQDALNSAVLRDEAGTGWYVYFLTPMKHDGQLPIGGHTRVHVDAAGEHVIGTDYATRGCMVLDVKESARLAPAGADYTPMLTQITADVPWETLVLQSLTGAQDLIVVTRYAVWRVAKGHITKLTVEPAKAAQSPAAAP